MRSSVKHSTAPRALVWAAALAIGLAAACPASAACRLALALGLDISGSVDDREYDLQLTGIARALAEPDVRNAFFADPNVPVAFAVYEWSSSSYQNVIVNWRLVDAPTVLDQISAELTAWSRAAVPEATGLGAAMRFGANLIKNGPECLDQTLDISADGKNNDWPLPDRLRASGEISWLRINALVVAMNFPSTQDRTNSGAAELASYFQTYIIQGPGAFTEVALGYEDYADAMRRKLIRELASLPLGQLPKPLPLRRADLTVPPPGRP